MSDSWTCTATAAQDDTGLAGSPASTPVRERTCQSCLYCGGWMDHSTYCAYLTCHYQQLCRSNSVQLPGVCFQTCAGAAAYPSADASVCTEKVQRSTTSCVAALVTTITNRCSVPDANHSAAVQTRQRATTGQQGVCLQLGERVDLKCSSRNKGGGRKEGSRPDSKHLKSALKPRAYAFLHQLYQARAVLLLLLAWAESRLQRLPVSMIFHTDPCAAHLASAP